MRRPPTEAVMKLLAGVTSVEQFARDQGVTLEASEALKANALQRFEQVLAPRRSPRLGWLAAAALVPAIAFAQLVTFTPDTPAVASEVNANFAQLRTWIEQKVGTVGSNAITTGAVTAASVNSSGAVSAASVSSSGAVTAASATLTGALQTGSLTVAGNAAVGGTLTVTGLATLNGVTIRVKNGNNGTASCDAFCASASFSGFGGACVGIRLPSGQFSNDCSFTQGLPVGQQLTCLCATF